MVVTEKNTVNSIIRLKNYQSVNGRKNFDNAEDILSSQFNFFIDFFQNNHQRR